MDKSTWLNWWYSQTPLLQATIPSTPSTRPKAQTQTSIPALLEDIFIQYGAFYGSWDDSFQVSGCIITK
jgi:hypothetical protein